MWASGSKSDFNEQRVENVCGVMDSHAQKGHLFLQLEEASGMISAFYRAYLDVETQSLVYKIWFCDQPKEGE